MTSLLKSLLLCESPGPKIILITGSLGTSYQLLVQYLLKQLLAQKTSCLYHVESSTFSKSCFSWPEDFADVQHFASTFHNYGEDSCPLDDALRQVSITPGHDSGVSRLSHLDACADGRDVELICESHSGVESERPVLLLEGVEALLLRTTVRCLLAALQTIVQGGGVVVLACGPPLCLPPASLAALRHSVAASIDLSNIETSTQQRWHGVARTRLRRPGGKFLHSCEYYKLEQSSVLTSPYNEAPSTDASTTCPPLTNCCGANTRCNLSDGQQKTGSTDRNSDREVDKMLTSQTTFSLHLSDQEKKDKNSVELPHHRARGGGLVLYTPDREDWDEDDPDDDLDI